MLSRRYRCYNPKCSAVQAAVKRSMATAKGDRNIYVGEGKDKRVITAAERAAMWRGVILRISRRVLLAASSGVEGCRSRLTTNGERSR